MNHPKLIDLTGQKFGRLTAVSYAYSGDYGQSLWRCQCECGNIALVASRALRTGITHSCGCFMKEVQSARMTKMWDEIRALRAGSKG